MKRIITLISVILFNYIVYSQTIEQRLEVIQNDKTVGGTLILAVEVKGTDLPAANTLGSATIDINYDNTKLTYSSSSSWAFGSTDGYSRSATNNGTFIRILVLGSTVNGDGGGVPAGYDVTSSYSIWVQLTFTISDASGSINFNIDPGSNAIGLFENHSNDPEGGIINQTLTSPEIVNNEPLPIELAAFSAKQSGSKIDLSWQTKTEVHNYGFEIERKEASENTKKNCWNKIGFIQGCGNSNSPKEYQFVDNELFGGSKFSYRLKQLDIDGHFVYSDEIEIEAIPDNYYLSQNYPNPFNPTTNIEFQLVNSGLVTLIIYDLLGNEVSTIINKEFEPGFYKYQWDASNKASGVYFCRIKADNYTAVKKMILCK